MNFKLITLSLILVISFEANAVNPVWGGWDRANSVAKEKSWLVIRQPNEGFCYIKQGYDGYSDKLEIIIKKDNVPVLISPFYRGLEGKVEYCVDKGQVRNVPAELIIKLSSSLVPELKNGSRLTVKFKPVGKRSMQQEFSLSGFTKAHAWLDSTVCKEKVADKY